MFVTLKNFFENFRIRNGDKPNETVFNRPLFRLKREIRELKSVQDIITGVEIETWSSVKFYERDEYVTFNGKFYRSVNDGNVGNPPDNSSATWVEENPIRFYTKDEIDSKTKYNIKNINENYTVNESDFSSNTLIRVTGLLTITVPSISDNFIGNSIVIKNSSIFTIQLVADTSATILGNLSISANDKKTLVFIGNNTYDTL